MTTKTAYQVTWECIAAGQEFDHQGRLKMTTMLKLSRKARCGR